MDLDTDPSPVDPNADDTRPEAPTAEMLAEWRASEEEDRRRYIDHLLTYHPPTPEQAPLYARIVAEVKDLEAYMERIVRPMVRDAAEFDKAGALIRCLLVTILEVCPRGDGQQDAIRALRYVRNGINAHLHLGRRSNGLELIVAQQQLLLCRWSACSAIALD